MSGKNKVQYFYSNETKKCAWKGISLFIFHCFDFFFLNISAFSFLPCVISSTWMWLVCRNIRVLDFLFWNPLLHLTNIFFTGCIFCQTWQYLLHFCKLSVKPFGPALRMQLKWLPNRDISGYSFMKYITFYTPGQYVWVFQHDSIAICSQQL